MDPYRLMLQSLLADRFSLKSHVDSHVILVYELVIAKSGSRLKASEMDPANPTETMHPRSLRVSAGNAAGAGVTTGMLAEFLERTPELGGGPDGQRRIVIDKTGLRGEYDWTLHWTPEGPDPGSTAQSSADSNGPSLFTALQEQLGLKLNTAKAHSDVLIIDHIDPPSAN
jgi:uncharacterized protein (TIGR03435 family)